MNQPAKYQKEPKNARALSQAMAWLQAVGISYKLAPVPEDGQAACDLVLEKMGGGEIEVKLAMNPEEPVPAGCLAVLAKELASPQSETALKAFHSITEAAGYGSPVPVDRGPLPAGKLKYSDHFELVSFRHREFRRAPNPNAQELAQYEPVLEQACYRFVNMNQDLCRRHCLQVEDLKTYARVWACTFLGLYKVARETSNDNVKKLRAHLKQRFAEFAGMMRKKEKNCFPTADTVQIALLGQPLDYHHRLENFSVDPTQEVEEDREYMERHNELDLSNEDTRHRTAAISLAKHLQALPHDNMVKVLEDAAANTALCDDARAEATRQLRLHKKTCEQCGGTAPPPAETKPAETKPADPGAPQAPAPAAPDVSIEQRIEAARVAFVQGSPAVHQCTSCKKEFALQIRLMNRPALLDGREQTPKFQRQSRCSACRRSSKKSEA